MHFVRAAAAAFIVALTLSSCANGRADTEDTTAPERAPGIVLTPASATSPPGLGSGACKGAAMVSTRSAHPTDDRCVQ